MKPVNEVARHYDLLIDEGNDPVLDPPELAAYMDGWDGAAFMSALALTGRESVLEIGVGTGRLAVRIAPACREYTGVDISSASIARAKEHLAGWPQVRLVCEDFLTWAADGPFDVICSSLTFMHMEDKQAAAAQIARMLRSGGRAVISLSKDRSPVIDYGTRVLHVYPDSPETFALHMKEAGLTVCAVQETAFAYIISAVKGG